MRMAGTLPARQCVLNQQSAVPLIGREVNRRVGDNAEDTGSITSATKDHKHISYEYAREGAGGNK